jgi:2-polyprenyl-3-methyl-5-hydroxy-6-metoxy-1,4-benzoquinol methylase|tara:strand:- start:456 stop:1301 length:846 start_codon:yes stop_codon:yes gene_type:complete
MLEKPSKIVEKITEDIDPKEVICTTYQMRNFYNQLGDGFFSGLDIMNLIQHYKAVEMMNRGDVVLDVCCGRGLLLPLIRYYKREIEEYIGVDISERNIKEQTRRSGRKSIDGLDYYPFKVTHVISNVSEMSERIDSKIDFIVYTSSIEHMQKEDGIKSLLECYKLLKPEHKMFLSCPNTVEKKDPYDTQYAAHLYEWNLDELSTECKNVGFEIEKTFGLYAKKKKFDNLMEGNELYKKFKEYIPTPFLMSFFPVIYPEYADEVLMILKKPKYKSFTGFTDV